MRAGSFPSFVSLSSLHYSRKKWGYQRRSCSLGAGHPLIYYFIKDIKLDTETSDETVEEDRQKQAAEPNFIKGER